MAQCSGSRDRRARRHVFLDDLAGAVHAAHVPHQVGRRAVAHGVGARRTVRGARPGTGRGGGAHHDRQLEASRRKRLVHGVDRHASPHAHAGAAQRGDRAARRRRAEVGGGGARTVGQDQFVDVVEPFHADRHAVRALGLHQPRLPGDGAGCHPVLAQGADQRRQLRVRLRLEQQLQLARAAALDGDVGVEVGVSPVLDGGGEGGLGGGGQRGHGTPVRGRHGRSALGGATANRYAQEGIAAAAGRPAGVLQPSGVAAAIAPVFVARATRRWSNRDA